jgi:hypothetical protein
VWKQSWTVVLYVNGTHTYDVMIDAHTECLSYHLGQLRKIDLPCVCITSIIVAGSSIDSILTVS